MNISVLIEAADYLDDITEEHCYASTVPLEVRASRRRNGADGNSQGGRKMAHTQMEKHRRAYLRSCMQQLEEVVPLEPESPRHTTLSVLGKATKLIRNLQSSDRKHSHHKTLLNREQCLLLRRLSLLTKQRSLSECSTSTVSSSFSSSSYNDSDDDLAETNQLSQIQIS